MTLYELFLAVMFAATSEPWAFIISAPKCRKFEEVGCAEIIYRFNAITAAQTYFKLAIFNGRRNSNLLRHISVIFTKNNRPTAK